MSLNTIRPINWFEAPTASRRLWARPNRPPPTKQGAVASFIDPVATENQRGYRAIVHRQERAGNAEQDVARSFRQILPGRAVPAGPVPVILIVAPSPAHYV